jgi:molybdopterin synthase sulfur carrier subunit
MSVPDAQPQSPRPAVRAVLRLFAGARQAAGTGRAEVKGATVGDVLAWASREYGAGFAAVLESSRVWRNGEPAEADSPLVDGDEVAVLPPVSGGADEGSAAPAGGEGDRLPH